MSKVCEFFQKCLNKYLNKYLYIKLLLCVAIIAIPLAYIYDTIGDDFVFTASFSSDDTLVQQRFNISLIFDTGYGMSGATHLLGQRHMNGASVSMLPLIFNNLTNLRFDIGGTAPGQSLLLEALEIKKPLAGSVSLPFADIIRKDAIINDIYYEITEYGAEVVITGLDPFFYLSVDEIRQAADSISMITGVSLLLGASFVVCFLILAIPLTVCIKLFNAIIRFFRTIAEKFKQFPSFCRKIHTSAGINSGYEKALLVVLILLIVAVPLSFVSFAEAYTENPDFILTKVTPHATLDSGEILLNVEDVFVDRSFLIVTGWAIKPGEDIVNANNHVLLRDSETDEYILMNTDMILRYDVTSHFAEAHGFVDYTQSGVRARLHRTFLEVDREYYIYFWYNSDGNSIIVPTGRSFSTMTPSLNFITPDGALADTDATIKFDILHIEIVSHFLYISGLIIDNGEVIESEDFYVLLKDNYSGKYILMETFVIPEYYSLEVYEDGENYEDEFYNYNDYAQNGLTTRVHRALLENHRIYSVYLWYSGDDGNILFPVGKHISLGGFVTFGATELITDVQEDESAGIGDID